jgi:hypothetical protein
MGLIRLQIELRTAKSQTTPYQPLEDDHEDENEIPNRALPLIQLGEVSELVSSLTP